MSQNSALPNTTSFAGLLTYSASFCRGGCGTGTVDNEGGTSAGGWTTWPCATAQSTVTTGNKNVAIPRRRNFRIESSNFIPLILLLLACSARREQRPPNQITELDKLGRDLPGKFWSGFGDCLCRAV